MSSSDVSIFLLCFVILHCHKQRVFRPHRFDVLPKDVGFSTQITKEMKHVVCCLCHLVPKEIILVAVVAQRDRARGVGETEDAFSIELVVGGSRVMVGQDEAALKTIRISRGTWSLNQVALLIFDKNTIAGLPYDVERVVVEKDVVDWGVTAVSG